MKTYIRILLTAASCAFLTAVALADTKKATPAESVDVPTVQFSQENASEKAVDQPELADPQTVTQVDPAKSIEQLTALPTVLEGVVSLAEFKRYLAYQHKLRTDPTVSALNTEVMALVEQLQALQTKLDAARAKARAESSGLGDIPDRIKAALAKDSEGGSADTKARS